MSTHDSDTARLLKLLIARGKAGIHTSELRRMGATGNPSQRATDCEHRYGCQITREIEWWTDAAGKRRNGSRFTLDAEPSGTAPPPPVAAGLDADPSPQLFDTIDLDIPPVASSYADPEWEAA